MRFSASRAIQKLGESLRKVSNPGAMDEAIQKAIKQNEDMRKTSVPWKPDTPHPQSCYAFDHAKGQWVAKTPSPSAVASQLAVASDVTRLAVLAWNIDFMLPFPEERMAAGLATLEDLVDVLTPATAAVIYLQECVSSDLRAIAAAPWVRARFHVTDLDHQNWASGNCGTTTLVDRRLPLAALFRVHYAQTRMERDALFADVVLPTTNAGSSLSAAAAAAGRQPGAGVIKKTAPTMTPTPTRLLRLCNTHLESLALSPPFRPPQVRLFAGYMRERGVHGALAAGDFNAIQDFDRTLHSDNGLEDAYLELGGREDSDDGYTWGQQAAAFLRERFGCSRMDKVYFCGGLQLRSFERFGADVELEYPEQRKQLMVLGFEKPWITDHLGIKAEFDIMD
jgi:tyrosyl-DNA phosphodiesterase 2